MDTLATHAKNISRAVSKPFVALVTLLFLFFLCGAQGNDRDVINRSNFIFAGTIVRMNASNIEIVPNGPTAIVRVDEVLDAVARTSE